MTSRSESYGLTEPNRESAASTGRLGRDGIGRVRFAVLAILLLGHLLFSVFAVAPGHFVSDEGIYHQMAKAFADNGSLTLWPEYREFPSPELRTWNHVVGKDGSLQSQYPYLHPVIAWPFYEIAGFRGLFAMNAIAYVIVAAVCFLLAERLWTNRRIAADAVILLTLATYAWQYSQAAWSQMSSSAFLLAALYLGVCAVQHGTGRGAAGYALAAGMAIGLGAGIRLDVIFIAPALFIPLLFDSPPRFRVAGAMLLGLIPGMLLLSITNYAKFGIFRPLTYGRSSGAVSIWPYIPLMAIAATMFATIWIFTRESIWPILLRHRLGLAVAGLLTGATVLFLFPSIAAISWRLVRGTSIVVLDLSMIDPSVGGIGITRGPAGSIMYAATVKKALVQSLPWIPVAVMALICIPRCRQALLAHAAPILTVMAFLTVYGFFTWHGGYAFNLRYFVPLLPILAIYGAKGIHSLRGDLLFSHPGLAATMAVIVAVPAWLFALFRDTEVGAIEAVTLKFPLILAAVLASLLILQTFELFGRRTRKLAYVVVFGCLAWSFVVSLMMDFPRSWFLRQARYETGTFLASHVPEDALLFLNYDPASFVLIEIPGAKNVWVSMDEYGDAKKIMQDGVAAGHPILAFFNDEDWVEFKERGMLDNMRPIEIADGSYATLYRLEPIGASIDGQSK